MTEESSRGELTSEQIIYRYESQLNRASLWVFLSGLAAVVAALALYWLLPVQPWIRMLVAVVVIVIGGGMLQRLFVLRVRCPVCGARVLGRIHSIFQARAITECPSCHKRLRG